MKGKRSFQLFMREKAKGVMLGKNPIILCMKIIFQSFIQKIL